MKNSILQPERLKAVLPRGAIKDIARRSNKTIFTVSRVINGKSRNQDVIKEVSEYLKELKATSDSIDASINTLTISQ